MIQRTYLSSAAACLLWVASGPAASAAGPIDGEIGAIYWNSDFESTGVATLNSDAAAPGLRASLWLFNRYGVRAGTYRSDLDSYSSIDSSDSTSLDVLWRPISPTQNNYFAVGLGYQQMDLNSIGLSGDTTGARLSVEGRIGLGKIVFLYAEGAYAPRLDDAAADTPGFGQFEDLSGMEYEVGVSWKMFPFVQLRAGFRDQEVEFNQTGIDPLLGFGTQMEGTAESSGVLAGLTFNF